MSEAPQIDALRAVELHPLGLEQVPLHRWPGQLTAMRDPTLPVDDTVPGNIRIFGPDLESREGEPDLPGRSGRADGRSNLPVADDLSGRDLAHFVVYAVPEARWGWSGVGDGTSSVPA